MQKVGGVKMGISSFELLDKMILSVQLENFLTINFYLN